ncbi:hypothetical protein BDP81DRAFT_389101 [Colletotrichum phormii]|uniref:Uncharacterized protein n=1 Tax=Colletotrichum phormii TaxID=359342 RepID=A0AAJ0A785_9PEZI|nr:uncharacterized protein BDP81DRAFT_389101 [Colletotrichum phormii]KAK1656302.1 hypothetical protein BDP81DRAFT_389101 [Colletotrichum phormii]
MELGFLDKRNSDLESQSRKNEDWQYQIDPWINTVDSQKSHEDNNGTDWNDQRRYTLSIIMAQHERRINMRSTDDTFEHAISTLIRNSAASGIFPGKIDDRLETVEYDYLSQRDA